ncbi:MAG TPA: MmgE/PrpD family protein [Solirubrobacteraceae bacterium]|jgi:2-methylcitrate dehydratase PrpD
MVYLAERLGRWGADLTIDDVPGDVVLATQKALLNSIGTMLGAFELEDVQRALLLAKANDESGPSTVFVDGSKLPLMSALFVNGVMCNTLGQEETHPVSGTHPAETTVPAVLAVAELRRISGRALLEAALTGIETTIAVARMALTPAVKYDNCEAPAVYGTVGAAAAAGRALGLDAERLGHAIALGANLAGGLSECVRVGTSEYHYSVGNASTHGVLAALLAEAGKPAAPASLEGVAGFYQLFGAAPRESLANHDVVGDVMGTLAEGWGVLELIYKPYPVYFFNQPHIDGARALREAHRIDPAAVEAIRITINPLAAASGGLNTSVPGEREAGLGSTAFCVAAMLTRGHVNLADTLAFDDAAIGRLMALTEISPSDSMAAGRIEVDAGGETHVFDAETAGRDYRLGFDDVVAIFHQALDGVLPREQADIIEAEVRRLPDLPDGGLLVELLSRKASGSGASR